MLNKKSCFSFLSTHWTKCGLCFVRRRWNLNVWSLLYFFMFLFDGNIKMISLLTLLRKRNSDFVVLSACFRCIVVFVVVSYMFLFPFCLRVYGDQERFKFIGGSPDSPYLPPDVPPHFSFKPITPPRVNAGKPKSSKKFKKKPKE